MHAQHFSSRFLACLAALLLLCFTRGEAAAERLAQSFQQTPQIKIDSPRDGDALQGVVSVTGTTEVEGFRSMELAFAYQADTTGTWFLIARSSTAVKEGALTSWDTTTISDGSYRLRVQVTLEDGRVLETIVDELRVRNYLPVETATPGSRAGQVTPTPTHTPLPDFEFVEADPTPLPTNPAVITQRDLQASLMQGALVVAGAFGLVGLYLALRAAFRR
jgi:hypothetical protein